MTTNTLKTTLTLGGDLEVNRVGFGAMRITGPSIWGMPDNPQNSIDLLRRAVELGVTFIDTADMYGPFTSEQLIADALHPYADKLVVGTKGGLVRFGPWAEFNNDATPQHLHDALNGSLQRLKLDHIDLYQLHRIDPNVPAERSFGFLKQAQQDGKVRHLGLSEVSVDEIQKAQEFFTVASVQNRYSVYNREWEPVLDYCQQQGIVFIPWFPIGGGMDAKNDAIMQRVADAHGVTTHQIALSWLLHRADNILLIPGTSSIEHLEENMQVGRIALSDDDMVMLNSIAG
ncbi:aryl-alcohol dehydrogenase-like predicted oxidoreductase [Spirosoma oryzae]|uniref:Aryl-alcohol dehydrogenase-like predicted oxidoreductase n=1 Tax=Spirosoma oryzae TaxID=1469603 RepID=A0A2T0TEY9_9BACT|nr:aldo/keto reductase [Spirosoma oryzae]PRY44236.1 aryl-alcohol dehydrogenase-like predicted oxidoreductase [Spirosoma oryzae]